MLFKVVISQDAETDILDVYRDTARADPVARADGVLAALDELCQNLAHMPQRGDIPKELVDIGIAEYREAHYKPYRVIYRIMSDTVVIYCVVDGRRDMRSFLECRLMRGSL